MAKMDRSSTPSGSSLHNSPPLTIRRLARLAGVSKSTASYALRDNGRIKAATRQRVRALAQRLGYSPNIIAATLAASKKARPVHALRIAFVTDLPAVAYNTRWFSPTREHLENLGYAAENFDLSYHRLSPVALRKRLYLEGFNGVIFSEIRSEASKIFAQDWSPFCVLTTWRTRYRAPFDQVRINPFECVATAWHQVRQAGYRRVGFLLGRHLPHRMLDDYEREGALFVMQQDMGSNETAIPPYLGELGDTVAMQTWVQKHQPDAVVGFHRFDYDLLAQAGFSIPRNFGFASLHTASGMAHVDPGEDEIPRICAEYMDQLIRNRRTGSPSRPREILAPVTWESGSTLPTKS
jgi:LacI family transcriptional regulator